MKLLSSPYQASRLPLPTTLVDGSAEYANTDPLNVRPLNIGKLVALANVGMESHVDTILTSLSPAARIAVASGGRANQSTASACTAVMTCHSDVMGNPALLRYYGGMQERLLQRADLIIVFAPHYEGSTQSQVPGIVDKIVRISTGVEFEGVGITLPDPEAIASIDCRATGRRMTLSAGRLILYKGYKYLIDAIGKLHSDAGMLLIGTRPLPTALERRVCERGLGERIHCMCAVVPTVRKAALRRWGVFCLSSIERYRAFGIASAGATAFGITTVGDGLHNSVPQPNVASRASFVFPPNTDALSEVLGQCVREDTLRGRLSRAARALVRAECNFQPMRRGTLALYCELI